uniref:NADH dehydrogenase subunit 6 n=1 Tax=Rhizophysa eysenhardtii TaxID=2721092 RepID=UPI0026E2F1B1|nr:NADH dehydrogenase subunit 6 [Rhizophysa eysenhardtii]WJJ69942.1 NADH dehydrogenase subunit 6 [Rhizophysa eysenhardtii]
MVQLFNFFSLLIIFSVVMAIVSFNPIHSVFWLVFVFLSSSSLLISMGVDFIPLIIIIVYVGAIAILFLFVIMMLDVIQLKQITSIKHILPILIISGVNIIMELLIIFRSDVIFGNNVGLVYWSFENTGQVHLIASMIYSDFFYPLALLSILLLIAMIGAIVLTLELGLITRKQVLSDQHHRNNSWV